MFRTLNNEEYRRQALWGRAEQKDGTASAKHRGEISTGLGIVRKTTTTHMF